MHWYNSENNIREYIFQPQVKSVDVTLGIEQGIETTQEVGETNSDDDDITMRYTNRSTWHEQGIALASVVHRLANTEGAKLADSI